MTDLGTDAPVAERLITHLRQVDLAVADYDKQLEAYTRTWGLKAEAADSGIAFLAAGGRWGIDDVRGTANRIGSAKRRQAAHLIRTGDTFSLSQSFDMDGPHQVAIPNMCLFLGEMCDPDALALACADDGVYDFVLTALPLPITGAVSSPVNPIAVR